MSEQYIGERVERPQQDMTSPVVNLDVNADQDRVIAVDVPETPMIEGLAATATVDEMTVQMAPQSEATTYEAPAANVESPVALIDREESEHFRNRWNEIQARFVDEPRKAVQQADGLVSEVVEKITKVFDTEHSTLEGQWNKGNDVSTEDLRKALQHYRTFFNRLVI